MQLASGTGQGQGTSGPSASICWVADCQHGGVAATPTPQLKPVGPLNRSTEMGKWSTAVSLGKRVASSIRSAALFMASAGKRMFLLSNLLLRKSFRCDPGPKATRSGRNDERDCVELFSLPRLLGAPPGPAGLPFCLGVRFHSIASTCASNDCECYAHCAGLKAFQGSLFGN